jgi:hypothetical protein
LIFFFSLIPAGAFSEDGKKHVNSVAVRLRKLQGIEQTKHQGKLKKSAIFFNHLFRLSFYIRDTTTCQRFSWNFWK